MDLPPTVEILKQAVIAWSQRLGEQKKQPASTFELAATLLGSGGTGVSAGEAARLIADGVSQANQLLGGGEGDEHAAPRVSHLRFIELYLERATEAWRSMCLQAEATPGRYEIHPVVQAGTGAMLRPPDLGYRGAEFDFITVEAVEDAAGTPVITYKLDTRRARSEVRGRPEASQLASASPNEIATRTGAYWADQVPVCWVTTADRPWAHSARASC